MLGQERGLPLFPSRPTGSPTSSSGGTQRAGAASSSRTVSLDIGAVLRQDVPAGEALQNECPEQQQQQAVPPSMTEQKPPLPTEHGTAAVTAPAAAAAAAAAAAGAEAVDRKPSVAGLQRSPVPAAADGSGPKQVRRIVGPVGHMPNYRPPWQQQQQQEQEQHQQQMASLRRAPAAAALAGSRKRVSDIPSPVAHGSHGPKKPHPVVVGPIGSLHPFGSGASSISRSGSKQETPLTGPVPVQANLAAAAARAGGAGRISGRAAAAAGTDRGMPPGRQRHAAAHGSYTGPQLAPGRAAQPHGSSSQPEHPGGSPQHSSEHSDTTGSLGGPAAQQLGSPTASNQLRRTSSTGRSKPRHVLRTGLPPTPPPAAAAGNVGAAADAPGGAGGEGERYGAGRPHPQPLTAALVAAPAKGASRPPPSPSAAAGGRPASRQAVGVVRGPVGGPAVPVVSLKRRLSELGGGATPGPAVTSAAARAEASSTPAGGAGSSSNGAARMQQLPVVSLEGAAAAAAKHSNQQPPPRPPSAGGGASNREGATKRVVGPVGGFLRPHPLVNSSSSSHPAMPDGSSPAAWPSGHMGGGVNRHVGGHMGHRGGAPDHRRPLSAGNPRTSWHGLASPPGSRPASADGGAAAGGRGAARGPQEGAVGKWGVPRTHQEGMGRAPGLPSRPAPRRSKGAAGVGRRAGSMSQALAEQLLAAAELLDMEQDAQPPAAAPAAAAGPGTGPTSPPGPRRVPSQTLHGSGPPGSSQGGRWDAHQLQQQRQLRWQSDSSSDEAPGGQRPVREEPSPPRPAPGTTPSHRGATAAEGVKPAPPSAAHKLRGSEDPPGRSALPGLLPAAGVGLAVEAGAGAATTPTAACSSEARGTPSGGLVARPLPEQLRVRSTSRGPSAGPASPAPAAMSGSHRVSGAHRLEVVMVGQRPAAPDDLMEGGSPEPGAGGGRAASPATDACSALGAKQQPQQQVQQGLHSRGTPEGPQQPPPPPPQQQQQQQQQVFDMHHLSPAEALQQLLEQHVGPAAAATAAAALVAAGVMPARVPLNTAAAATAAAAAAGGVGVGGASGHASPQDSGAAAGTGGGWSTRQPGQQPSPTTQVVPPAAAAVAAAVAAPSPGVTSPLPVREMHSVVMQDGKTYRLKVTLEEDGPAA